MLNKVSLNLKIFLTNMKKIMNESSTFTKWCYMASSQLQYKEEKSKSKKQVKLVIFIWLYELKQVTSL